MKFLHPPKIVFQKKKRFNPSRIWAIVCVSFLVIIVLLLAYFSWYFVETNQMLDAPATATFETNATKIISMQKMLDQTEAAVQTRTGNTQ